MFRRRARALGIRHGQTGSVSFVQRFGGALNLNPHVHSLLPDGLFVPGEDGGSALFVVLPEPTPADIEALTFRIARRLTVERLCTDDFETQAVLERTAAARVTVAVASGQRKRRAGSAARRQRHAVAPWHLVELGDGSHRPDETGLAEDGDELVPVRQLEFGGELARREGGLPR